MSERPEYVRCVRASPSETWCNRPTPQHLREFLFLDPTHAVNNAYTGGRLLICPECADAMTRTISAGRWTPNATSDERADLSKTRAWLRMMGENHATVDWRAEVAWLARELDVEMPEIPRTTDQVRVSVEAVDRMLALLRDPGFLSIGEIDDLKRYLDEARARHPETKAPP